MQIANPGEEPIREALDVSVAALTRVRYELQQRGHKVGAGRRLGGEGLELFIPPPTADGDEHLDPVRVGGADDGLHLVHVLRRDECAVGVGQQEGVVDVRELIEGDLVNVHVPIGDVAHDAKGRLGGDRRGRGLRDDGR